jgi:hypothetical protein
MKTGAGAGLLFVSPLGEHMRYAVRLHFPGGDQFAKGQPVYRRPLPGVRVKDREGWRWRHEKKTKECESGGQEEEEEL